MADTFTFTLDDETEKKLFELLTDMDVSKTPSFSIKDKHGNEAEYFKVVRCNDCKHKTKCYSDVVMIDKSRTADIYESVEWCSFGERRTKNG